VGFPSNRWPGGRIRLPGDWSDGGKNGAATVTMAALDACLVAAVATSVLASLFPNLVADPISGKQTGRRSAFCTIAVGVLRRAPNS
jgi:hypothetical protein